MKIINYKNEIMKQKRPFNNKKTNSMIVTKTSRTKIVLQRLSDRTIVHYVKCD